MSLSAKAGSPSNNFYFTSNNNNIDKKGIFKFNDKIFEGTKKPN